eukprot:scaffold3031_cov27-Phaeocystis_antarctica.AAC.1
MKTSQCQPELISGARAWGWCATGGSCCPGRVVERERVRWHDPVLGRWLGLTPEQPALCLRGFPRRPRAAPSRVSDPPGLGRRQGAQGAARGAVREKRYNLSDHSPRVRFLATPELLTF